MISLFSLPKAFKGHTDVIQRNALASWNRLGCEVILIGDDDGTAAAAKSYGCRHVPDIARTAAGTPRVDALFAAGELAASEDMLCYVNADIILLGDFLPAVERVAVELPWFLGTGRRWDLDVDVVLDASSVQYEETLRRRLSTAELHPVTGLDYFVFRRGLWPEIPPFAIGRTMWDNWLLWRALREGAALVDLTRAVTAIHQKHDYGHIVGGESAAWKGEEALQNQRLARGYGRTANVTDATHVLREDGSITRLGRTTYRRHAFRRLLSSAAFRVRGPR
jgi:hypothetical protein